MDGSFSLYLLRLRPAIGHGSQRRIRRIYGCNGVFTIHVRGRTDLSPSGRLVSGLGMRYSGLHVSELFEGQVVICSNAFNGIQLAGTVSAAQRSFRRARRTHQSSDTGKATGHHSLERRG